MSGFLGFSRGKRGSTRSSSPSLSLSRDSTTLSQHDSAPPYFFRMRSIRSTMTPDKLLQCFREDYRQRLQLRPLVPGPMTEPEVVPELSAVASLSLADGEHIEPALLSSVVLIDDTFAGFTNLYEPTDPAVVDIIAVPAIGSHPYQTWSVQTRYGPEMWLQDMLPSSISRGRVLLYGHDLLRVDGQPDTIANLAAGFVADLRAMRLKSRISQRPLVIVAHSTGCLVVKKALCEMPELVEQELVKCTVFLGAPHDGLDRSALDLLVDSNLAGTLARELCAGSQVVLDLNSAFAPVADRLHIVAFAETLKTSIPSPTDAPSESSTHVVPFESATLFRSTERAIECDHFELAQTTNGAAIVYAEIVTELQAVLNDILRPAGWRVQQRNNNGPASPTSPESVSDYFAESPTSTMKSWPQPLQQQNQQSSARSYDTNAPSSFSYKSRTRSIPTPFRRRSSTQSIPQQLTLHYAVRANDMDEARRILETFTELDAKDPSRDNRTALHEAAARGNNEVAAALLDAGAAPEPRTRASFRTPLHFAAREGHEGVVKLLLERGAKVNSRSADYSTPLILAAEKGHGHVVRALLARDASVHIERDKGVSALELAELFGHDDIARVLRKRGAKINLDKPKVAPEYPGLF